MLGSSPDIGARLITRRVTGPSLDCDLSGFLAEASVRRPDVLLDGLGDESRAAALGDRLPGNDALGDVAARGQLELDVEEGLLEDRAQAAGAGLSLQRLVSDRLEAVVGEDELDVVELEEALELAGERVARLGQDRGQVIAAELMDCRDHRQAADELGDQAILDQVLRQHLLEPLAGVFFLARGDFSAEADSAVAHPALDHLVEFGEGAAADEEDVGGVDRQELLVGVLAPTLRRHRGGGPLENLQQRLLDAFARDVASDRRVVGFARDLVDLVDVDDSRFRLLDVEVGGLDQLQEDVLDVLADVAGLGQRSRVGDREGDVEDAGQGLGEQRLAAAGRAQHHDVRLLQLDLGLVGLGNLDPLVVVVNGDRKRALSGVLADYVLLQHVEDFLRFGQVLELEDGRRRQLLVDDLVAEVDALVADVDAGAGDQLFHLTLRLAAEAAEELLIRI